MKIIKVGEVNDLVQYALWDTEWRRYIPLSESDLQFQAADAKIYYDSGLYPSVTLEELPQYICNKATDDAAARKQAAAALGKVGGAATSDAKAAASRENGKRGGRPRRKANDEQQ